MLTPGYFKHTPKRRQSHEKPFTFFFCISCAHVIATGKGNVATHESVSPLQDVVNTSLLSIKSPVYLGAYVIEITTARDINGDTQAETYWAGNNSDALLSLIPFHSGQMIKFEVGRDWSKSGLTSSTNPVRRHKVCLVWWILRY